MCIPCTHFQTLNKRTYDLTGVSDLDYLSCQISKQWNKKLIGMKLFVPKMQHFDTRPLQYNLLRIYNISFLFKIQD